MNLDDFLADVVRVKEHMLATNGPDSYQDAFSYAERFHYLKLRAQEPSSLASTAGSVCGCSECGPGCPCPACQEPGGHSH